MGLLCLGNKYKVVSKINANNRTIKALTEAIIEHGPLSWYLIKRLFEELDIEYSEITINSECTIVHKERKFLIFSKKLCCAKLREGVYVIDLGKYQLLYYVPP